MSIFTETISRAICDYRQMLKRYFNDPTERSKKIAKFGLRDSKLYEDDVSLYKTAYAIVHDIEENIGIPHQTYYSYSGVGKFCEYLKEYLEKYELDGVKVVHKGQKASNAMIQAIQLIALPDDKLTELIAERLKKCNKIIATFGSGEQQEMYRETLLQNQARNVEFYSKVANDFQQYFEEQELQAVQA